MDIHTFTALVGETPRQIRFMVTEGFLPPPTGSRARAQYGPEHVAAVRRYRWLRKAYSPQQIKLILGTEAATLRLPVAPGITLLLDPALADQTLEPEAIAERVRELLIDMPGARAAAAADRKDFTNVA